MLFSISISAQEGLPTEQVEVIKNFEAQLEETEKVQVDPELPPLDTSTQLQSYRIPQTHQLDVEYPAPKIRPLAMRPDDLPDVYNAWLRLGAGLPSSFLGEGSYGKFVDDKYDVGLNLKYHSGNFKGDDVENQKFRKVDVGGNVTYYFDQGFAVGGDVKYTSNKFHYYGYNFDGSDTTGVKDSDVQQHFNTIDIKARIFNGVENVGDINYAAGIDFYNHQDNFASKEDGLNLYINATKWISGAHSFDFNISGDFTTYNDTMKQKLNNYYFQPAFTYHGDVFKAKIGLNLVANNDDFSFFPDIEAIVNLTGSELAVFGGATGDLQKNTYRSLSDYNNYVSYRFPAMTIKNTKYFEYYGGIKGNVKVFEYMARVGVKTVDTLATFVVDSFPSNPLHRTFGVLYQNGNILSIGGSIKANITKNVELVGTANYNVYDMDTEIKAWHLPRLQINGALFVTMLEEKLRVKGQLFMENGVPFRQSDGTSESLNSLFDLSFGAEYFLADNFGVFFELNNLLDNKRQRWRHYPTYGLNVLLGASARF